MNLVFQTQSLMLESKVAHDESTKCMTECISAANRGEWDRAEELRSQSILQFELALDKLLEATRLVAARR